MITSTNSVQNTWPHFSTRRSSFRSIQQGHLYPADGPKDVGRDAECEELSGDASCEGTRNGVGVIFEGVDGDVAFASWAIALL